MKLRVVFLLFALVLTWSGHTLNQRGDALVSISAQHHEGQHASTLEQEAAVSGRDASSVGHPILAVEEAVIDLVGLVPIDGDASSPALLMTWPGPYATLAWIAPYLDGPQRPPRAKPHYA
jgi:hypothetical protein